MTLEISGIPVNIKKKEIKNIHLYVKAPNGRVEVTAPVKLNENSIKLFVRSKLSWIRKQQLKFNCQERQSVREYVSGETFYLLGKGYYLHVIEGTKYSIEQIGNIIRFTVRAGSTQSQREKWANEWYRSILKERIADLLSKLEEKTGLHPSEWHIKYMTTRWGTCNPSNKIIYINLQLAKKPIDCLEYVIMHELVHLRVRNHGKEFVDLMDGCLPNWRDIRKKLNDTKLDYMEPDDGF